MDDKTEIPGGLSENQGKPGTGGAAGSHKLPVGHGVGSDAPAHDPVPHEAEDGEANTGPQQEQAGMRS